MNNTKKTEKYFAYINLDNHKTCRICYSRIKLYDFAVYVKCSHEYHSLCYYKWIKITNKCPICRY